VFVCIAEMVSSDFWRLDINVNNALNACSVGAVTLEDIPAERPGTKNNPFFCAQMFEQMIGIIGQVVAIFG
jgi:hypothetical protein